MDTLASGEVRGLNAGKRVVLSKDFPGSDCDVQCRFMVAMVVATYGRPDYFVTMTCNPYWPEITNSCCLAKLLGTDQILWRECIVQSFWIFMIF